MPRSQFNRSTRAAYTLITTPIPSVLHAQVKSLLLNERTGKIRYSALSSLVTFLLQSWVEAKFKEHDAVEGKTIDAMLAPENEGRQDYLPNLDEEEEDESE
jgi:hypothetical protein